MSSNTIGNAGENIFALRIMKEGIFRAYFLGDKAPVVDFLIEIVDEEHPYQCLFQVKSTNTPKSYSKQGYMKTPVPSIKLKKLIERPLPTYVAGVDVLKEVVFIAPAFDMGKKFTTIPPIIRLDRENKVATKQNLIRLKDDIINYWSYVDIQGRKQTYKSLLL